MPISKADAVRNQSQPSQVFEYMTKSVEEGGIGATLWRDQMSKARASPKAYKLTKLTGVKTW